MDRRDFLKNSGLTMAVVALGRDFWRSAFATPAPVGVGPYGPLGAPDANGIALPGGFASRVLARSGQPVGGAAYIWHIYPDGGATFRTPDGGWIYVSNSEVPGAGGAGSITFDAAGNVVGARRVLAGTSSNCAGGSTPWGTWLSCEETVQGQVWECDPAGVRPAIPMPAMGLFAHEAAVVDPATSFVYLTEDTGDSAFYRFRPDVRGSLVAGVLEVATLGAGDPLVGPVPVTWTTVPDPTGLLQGATRNQVPGVSRFKRGEGAWFDSGIVYFTTTTDHRVWAYDTRSSTIEVIYDANAFVGAPLREPDNIMVAPSGDIYVAEDDGDLGLEMITREHTATSFLKLSGPSHAGSELAGPAFDPSGKRLYFSSQRGDSLGITYEITGPFRP